MSGLYCISGPSSTGKSTLLAELKKHLPDAVFVQEWARHLFETKYKSEYRDLDHLLAEKAYEFQTELAKMTVGNSIPGKTVIVDRAPLDIFIYSLLNMGGVGVKGLMEIMQIVISSCQDVDAVFMTKDLGFYEDDGLRSDLYRKNRQTEVYMFEHYPDAMMKNVIWLPNNTDERVQTILSYFESAGVYHGPSASQLSLI